MSVNDEIVKAREIYRKKKTPVTGELPKQIAAVSSAKRGESIKEYFTIFFTIMKRDITSALGFKTPEDEKQDVVKQEYFDFMEAHFGSR